MNKFVVLPPEDEILERRKKTDRRADFKSTTFPVFTKQGTWIRKECRKTPERRVENIDVAEASIDAEEFKELFKDYSS